MRSINLKYYCLAALFCVWGSLAFAQAKPDTVIIPTTNYAIALAIKSNPTQAVYRQQILQARYNYKASKGYLYPSASASFAGTDNLHLAITPVPGELVGKPGTTYNLQFGKKYVYNTGITLGYDVFNWQNVVQAGIAKNNLLLSEVQQDAYVQSLKEQVAKIYFSALIAKASLKTITNDQVLADSLVSLAKQRLNVGATDALQVNQAIINYNSVLQNRAQSTQLYEQGIENLKILIGGQPESEIKLADNVSLDALSENLDGMLNHDKSLDVYEQQEKIAGLQSKAQRSVAYPTFSATGYFGDEQYRNDFGLSFSNSAWSAYRYIGINLSVPIFTGFTNSNKYKSSVVAHSIAKQQFDNAKQQSEINDRLLIKNDLEYLALVQASENSFKLYQDNLVLNKQKYTEGVTSIDVYLKAFQDYLTAENTYLNNLSQLLSVKATIISRQ
jgi:outer membrane protein